MDIQPESSLRADIYLLLSTLFRQAPSPALLELLTLLDTVADDSEMQNAWLQLKAAASCYSDAELEEEYQHLFIGIGRGEVVPFASWHLTGSLMEKPLAGKEAMMKEKNEINESRRDLLKGIATAAVAGAVVAGTTQVASASEVTPVEKQAKKRDITKPSISATITKLCRSHRQ